MSKENPLDGLTPRQRVDVYNYAIQSNSKIAWLASFAIASGKNVAFIAAVSALIGALIRWAPRISSGIHFLD